MALSKEELVRELARLVDIVIAEDDVTEVADRFQSLVQELTGLTQLDLANIQPVTIFPRRKRMVSSDMAFLSAAETAKAIRTKQVSPVEVVQAYLARIERLDATLHAYITVLRQEALAAARQAEQQLMSGAELGPLFGVPIAVKDQFWTKGILTTNGSRVYRHFIPPDDATVITRLREAGTILLGKLTLSELAMGGTRQPPWGIPCNPWDLERTPGESSSGSGVALAAHLCAASVGEDTGGSGRGPGAYCSVVGLRPTFTRVSRYGMTPMCWFMDAAAPMTKTVEDCALVLGAIAGYDPPRSFHQSAPCAGLYGTARAASAGYPCGHHPRTPRPQRHASRSPCRHRHGPDGPARAGSRGARGVHSSDCFGRRHLCRHC